jgi:hypothetical protein
MKTITLTDHDADLLAEWIDPMHEAMTRNFGDPLVYAHITHLLNQLRPIRMFDDDEVEVLAAKLRESAPMGTNGTPWNVFRVTHPIAAEQFRTYARVALESIDEITKEHAPS